MKKIIGLITGWGSEDWMAPAIEQALYLCDEVIVGVGAWSEYMDEFEDNTLAECEKYNDRITLVPYHIREKNVNESVALSLNYMLSQSKLYEAGNWIWLLDCDEFYYKKTKELINSIIGLDKWNRIDVETKFYLINTRYYLESSYMRLWKIEELNLDPKLRFRPTHHWCQTPEIVKVPMNLGMHHYSMLKNPHAMVKKWSMEYAYDNQDYKIKWANEIYKHYDLNDEHTWLKKNKEVSGIYHPWFSDTMSANVDGTLRYLTDDLPEFIANTKLADINDFREFYRFT